MMKLALLIFLLLPELILGEEQKERNTAFKRMMDKYEEVQEELQTQEANIAQMSKQHNTFKTETQKDIEELLKKIQAIEELVQEPAKVCKCPFGFRRIGEKCYWYSHYRHDYLSAHTTCAVFGSQLAIFTTKDEERTVKNAIAHGHSFFVKANDIAKEGYFSTPWAIVPYASWGHGEPNDHNSNEDCVEVRIERDDWNDVPCGNHLHFLCEAPYCR